MQIVAGDGVAGIKRRRRDQSSDSVRNLAKSSGRGRLKEDLESSNDQRMFPNFVATLLPNSQEDIPLPVSGSSTTTLEDVEPIQNTPLASQESSTTATLPSSFDNTNVGKYFWEVEIWETREDLRSQRVMCMDSSRSSIGTTIAYGCGNGIQVNTGDDDVSPSNSISNFGSAYRVLVYSFEARERFLALGWHLEEIHVTWAHLEKKQTRL
ncbi:hypothetical protein Tco_0363601 [Tanacetum coccineum]